MSPGTCSVLLATNASPPTVTVTAPDTASTTGAREAKAGANTDSPTLTGPSPGKDMPACTFSPVSPRASPTPFILSLPEGFVINRKWWGQDGAHWATTHDLRFDGSNFSKKIVLVGSGFKTGCFMWWDGNKEKGTWVVKAWPQYAVAVPKGNDHVWY